MKIYFQLLLTVSILLGCSKSNDVNIRCNGKLSLRNELNPKLNRDYVDNIEMVLKVKDSTIYQLNNDGYVLIGQEGVSCNVNEEFISCGQKKNVDSDTFTNKSIKIRRNDGLIETTNEGFNTKSQKVITTTRYIGNCEKVSNKL